MRASYPTYKSTSIPWLPEMPEHWELRRNKYLLKEINKRSLRGEEDLLSVSQYTGVTLKKDRLENDGDLLTTASTLEGYKVVRKDDLVINIMLAWNGSLGVSAYDGIASPAYCVYRFDRNINPKYYHYLFRTDFMKLYFRSVSSGVIESRLRMYTDDFYRLYSFLPPLPEQTAIANYLDAKSEQINRFIAKKEKLIALLKEQKQAVINELLEDKEGKWERRKMKFLAKVFFSNVDKHSIEEEIPVLLCNYTDVYKNEFIGSSFDFMQATATIAEIKKFAVKKGDVLVTKDSETADDIANPAFVVEQIDNLVCGYHLAQIRTGSQLLGEFLFRVLQSKAYNKHFEVHANGVTRVGLSISAFTDFMVPLPSINEQENIIFKIRTEYNRIDNAINRIEKEIEKVKELKQSLIAEVVTGRIKVA
ncbi:MAG: restriction endonuclease subunit S [Chitinophagaceae bacterium]|nr:restriction endonuclease subunit S [Chitinophagaceae bacterium]